MADEHLATRHEPHAITQIASCTGKEHATHREITGMVLYYCNCGYSSGWVDKASVPDPYTFISEHRPEGLGN